MLEISISICIKDNDKEVFNKIIPFIADEPSPKHYDVWSLMLDDAWKGISAEANCFLIKNHTH
jgi:hypothetical protein